MDLSPSEIEYQDKLGNMRSYWNKLVGHNSDLEKPKINESKCKIVDVQTKVEDVKKKFQSEEDKDEKPINKVQITKQLFENKPSERVEKVSPLIKNTCSFFENSLHDKNNQYESLNPNIVEIIENKNTEEKTNGNECLENQKKIIKSEKKRQHKPVTKSLSITYPEFDYVRYRVVKSDLFQKKIFAKCDRESQFDGLMQYLQDYSFQELLIDNNIVIIEPIRTTIIRENASKYYKPVKNVTPLLHKSNEANNQKNGLRKHFFYHPVRVNREVNDNELPNPDTVKQVRQLFEKKEKCITNTNRKKTENRKNIDLDKDICSVTRSAFSENGNNEYTSLDSFDEEPCCEQQYITEDVMEKIRKYGTTITYYGGRIVRKQSSQDSLTNVIMEEIKENKNKDFHSKYDTVGEKDNKYQGLKFKLVKSNSCSSRLELVGTQNLATSRQKYFKKRQDLIKEAEERTVSNKTTEVQNQKLLDKNEINECIKKQTSAQHEKQNSDNKTYTKWSDKTKEQTIYGIQFNDKMIGKLPLKTKYEYHNFQENEKKTKIIEDMDFEPYEIA
ncbi:hypothetical protein WA026_001067 [Henosepilachna vigintioctopunctata]|uniref:Uncharacterized protein n=1 Tax=Henosepilachna vigintioctopunctata TaxID=420089 RepID=A0AAW1V0J6_9CUCU